MLTGFLTSHFLQDSLRELQVSSFLHAKYLQTGLAKLFSLLSPKGSSHGAQILYPAGCTVGSSTDHARSLPYHAPGDSQVLSSLGSGLSFPHLGTATCVGACVPFSLARNITSGCAPSSSSSSSSCCVTGAAASRVHKLPWGFALSAGSDRSFSSGSRYNHYNGSASSSQRKSSGAFPDLPSLARAVQRGEAASWDVGALRAAFTNAAKLGMRPGERPSGNDAERSKLLEGLFPRLADHLLPLLPRLRDPGDCVMVLWACAKAGVWDRRLAAALLGRLLQGGGELLRRAGGKEHALLWWSLSEAPEEVRAALPVGEVLRASERFLVQMPPKKLNAQDCANVLIAVTRLLCGSGALWHHMTACLAELAGDANAQELANGVYALGKLAEVCGHTPRRQDLERLSEEVTRRLTVRRDGAAKKPQGRPSGDAL